MKPLEIVRPGAVRMSQLASDRDVVYIGDDRPDPFRRGHPQNGQPMTTDELLDAIFAADLVVTW